MQKYSGYNTNKTLPLVKYNCEVYCTKLYSIQYSIHRITLTNMQCVCKIYYLLELVSLQDNVVNCFPGILSQMKMFDTFLEVSVFS